MTPLETRIAAIKAECIERLPDLPKYGGEARARRAVLAVIEWHEWVFKQKPHLQPTVTIEALQAIADAWEGK